MSMHRNFETMTDAELADYQCANRDEPLGDEADLEEVKVKVAEPLSVSFRLPPSEASTIRTAAERVGMSMSDWIRGACSIATEKGAPPDASVPTQRVNMTKARRLVAELDRELTRVMERVEPGGEATSAWNPGVSLKNPFG